jgi:type IV pilus assembly protein PilP
MKPNRNSTLFAVPLLVALALSGCSKTEEKPPTPPPAPAPKAKPAGAPAAVQKQLSSATAGGKSLDFRNRIDPFKPYAPAVVPPPQAKNSQGENIPAADLLPIQSFEADKFKVAGIIAGLKENRALILDPNGKGYVVQQGMLIGNSEGRITRITATTVEIVENYKDDRSKPRKRTVVLTLAKKR